MQTFADGLAGAVMAGIGRMHFQDPLPWLVPGTLAFAVIGVFASAPLARVLRSRRAVSWLIIVSVAAIAFATLTPLYGTFETGPAGSTGCNLSTMSLVTLADFAHHDDRSRNVLLFIPLGLSLGLLPRSRRSLVLVVGAIALPFAIEGTQALLPLLHRSCESGDVIDNLTGLALGWVGGLAGALVTDRVSAILDPSPSSA